MALSISATDSALDATDKSSSQTTTFTSRAIGTAASDRYVVVVVATDDDKPTGVTIGGNAATQAGSGAINSSDGSVTIWYLLVTSGTTATIVVTHGGSISNTGIAVYRVVGSAAINVDSTLADTTDSSSAYSGSLTIPTNGVAVGGVATQIFNVAHTFTWTNLTEDYDFERENESGITHHQMSTASSASAGTSTRTATASNSGIEGCMYLVAFNDGAQGLTPSLFVNDTFTVYQHTETGGNHELFPSLFDASGGTFYAPTITQTGISIVGVAEGSSTSGVDFNISLPAGTSENDLVVVCSMVHDGASETPGPTTAGYTSAASISTNVKADVSYKKMTSTPDTVVNINASTGTFKVTTAVVMVFRGVDTATPMDVTATTANGSSGSPDSPSITPVSNFSAIISMFGAEVSDSSITAPSGYGNQVDINASNVTVNCTSGGSWKTLETAGAENPAAWSNITSGAWGAFTLALRATKQPMYPSLYTNDPTFHSPTVASLLQSLTQSATFVDTDTIYVGGGSDVDVSLTDSDVDGFSDVDGVATVSGMSIGAATGDRLVFAYLLGIYDIGDEIPTVTIGGVAATFVDTGGLIDDGWATNDLGAAWFWAAVPSGTEADVVVDAGDTGAVWTTLSVALYRVVNADTTTPVDDTAFNDATDPGAWTLDIPAGGAALAGALNGIGTPPMATWSGATEDLDTANNQTYGFTVASFETASEELGYEIGLDSTAGSPLVYGGAIAILPSGAGGGGLTVSIQTSLTPSLYTNSNSFYTPTVTLSSVNLQPSLFDDSTDTFHTPTVTRGTITLTPSLYTNTNNFYTQTVSTSYSLAVSLYSNGQTFFTHKIVKGLSASLFNNSGNVTFYVQTVTTIATIAPNLFTNSPTFHTPTVTRGLWTIAPSLFTDGDTFYTQTVSNLNTIAPSLYSDGDTFYTQTALNLNTIAPSLFANNNTFYTQTVSQGSVVLAPNLFTNTNTFYDPTVTSVYALTASLYTNTNNFYTQNITIFVAPNLFVSGTNAFYAPQLDLFIYPDTFINDDTFYTHTVTPGVVTLTASLYTNNQGFYTQTVSNLNTVAPSLFTNSATFYTQTIITSGFLEPALYENTNTFYQPIVAREGVQLFPALFQNQTEFHQGSILIYILPNTFVSGTTTIYAPKVDHVLRADLLTFSPQFYSPTLHQNINANRFQSSQTFHQGNLTGLYATTAPFLDDSTDSFYQPTVLNVNPILPGLFTDGDSFYDPTVTAVYAAQADLFTNTNTIYDATVSRGTITLLPSLFEDGDSFYTQTVLSVYTLVPSLFAGDSDTFYTQTVANLNTITPSLYTNAQAYYDHVISIGGNALFASLFTNSNSFYDPTVTPGAVLLQPSTFVDPTDSFYAPTATYTYTITPNLYQSQGSSYNHSVTFSKTLIPEEFIGGSTFYQQTVTPGTRTLSPFVIFENSNTFYTPSVVTFRVLNANLFESSATFYTPVVKGFNAVTASLFTSGSNNFYSPTVTKLNTIAPSLFVEDDTFYAPSVSIGATELLPDLFVGDGTFYSPTINLNANASLYENSNTFHAHVLIYDGLIAPNLFQNNTTFYNQTLTPGSLDVAPPLVVNGAPTFYTPVVEYFEHLIDAPYITNLNAIYAHSMVYAPSSHASLKGVKSYTSLKGIG